MTAPSPLRRVVAVLVAGAALSVFVSACGDDSGSSSADSTGAANTESGESPEEVIVPDSQVTAGLNQMITDMSTLAAGVADGTATSAQSDAVHTVWASFEGTVKQNNVDGYLAIEDALGAMQKAVSDKDAAAAKQASDDLETAANAYLAEHP
jgi:hypothetical protein